MKIHLGTNIGGGLHTLRVHCCAVNHRALSSTCLWSCRKKMVCEVQQVYPAERQGSWGAEGRAMQCIKFESWRLDPRCWGLLSSGLSILRCVCPSVWVCLICLYRRKTDASAWMQDTCASFGWKILLIIERTPMRIPYMKFWEHRTFANVTSLFHYRPKTFHEECLWLSSVSPNNWSWVALLFPRMSMRAARSDDRCGILWACFPDLSDWLLERLKPLHS